MAVAFEDFVHGLEQSGIISPDNLRAVCEKLPHDRQHDAQELARELVRQKILTTYQVKEAYQGKAKDLVLGNYTILDQIGQGGMGQVFKAEHRRMHRIVAIKLLPTAMTKDQAAIARFEREVTAAAKLRHPNIVAADDADEAAGRHFLVMEYVEGQDLSALVKKNGPLPVEQAVGCILQAARGLEYAHRRGVVHRDIKPANLLLEFEGTVKILDMGLARLESAAGEEHAELTGTGQIMGTVDYMATEQALNTKHADQRADIYSLGITLWYLLTGRAAFGGETVMEKLLAHREQPIPSLQAACPGATPALGEVFTKMLAKKAEDRFQSMSEVVAELERFHSSQNTARSVNDEQGEDHRLSEFLRGTNPSKATSGRTSVEPAVATKLPSSPVLEATMAMADSEIETDPKTEQSLVVPDDVAFWGKNWRASMGRRAWVLTACAAGAVALLSAGIVFYLETRQGTVRIEIIDPGIEVVVDGNGATIKGAKSEVIKLQPGKHGLRIKYGELDFETDKFILNRADDVVLKVELLDGKVQVVQGDTVLGERPLVAIAPFDAKQALAHQRAWANHLGTKVEIENSMGMKLRLIPPGEFMMGSPQEEIDTLVQSTTEGFWQRIFRSEGPRHGVKLTQAFYLGSCEVTQQQYQELMGLNPSWFSLTGPGKDALTDLDTGQHPVEQVSWFDAVDFCNKLSEKEERSPYYLHDEEAVKVLGGNGYRLPTEAEWEYACRAGTTGRSFFESDTERDLVQHAWMNSNAGNRTHRVGELSGNPFGLYDLYGNVCEWCWDWHSGYAVSNVSNPNVSKPGSNRVFRGGGWSDVSAFCRSAIRVDTQPRDRHGYLGFRVAGTIETKDEALPTSTTGDSKTQPDDTDPDAANVTPPLPAEAPFDAKQALAHQEAWAKHLGTKVEIENSLGMKLRLIPPGKFEMGSPQEEIDALVESTTVPYWHGWFRSEGPQHRVKLTQAFYLASCEVTQQQYQEVVGVNRSHFSSTGPGKDAVKDPDTSQHPEDQVSWFDAVDFCNKLSEREQRSPYYLRDGEVVKVLGGTGYRLPTEAEWEYACRAGTRMRWSFGDNETDLAQHAWYGINAGGTTHRVAALSANPFGLYDLYGNVWEWCWDWHGEYTAGAASDPQGSAVGSERVRRGGAYFHDWPISRSALHFLGDPLGRNLDTGFRVARTINAKGEGIPPATTGDLAAQANDTDPGENSVNSPESAIAPFDANQALAHQEAWATHLGTKVEIRNSLGMKLRLIPPGEFIMGSPQKEIDAMVETSRDPQWQVWFRSEGPQHHVKLTQAFYLGCCKVTQQQYQ